MYFCVCVPYLCLYFCMCFYFHLCICICVSICVWRPICGKRRGKVERRASVVGRFLTQSPFPEKGTLVTFETSSNPLFEKGPNLHTRGESWMSWTTFENQPDGINVNLLSMLLLGWTGNQWSRWPEVCYY